MGEAKQRGTFEQRKAKAIKRDKDVESKIIPISNKTMTIPERTMRALNYNLYDWKFKI